MTTKPLAKTGRNLLLFSPVIIVMVGYLGWLYWLRPKNSALVMGLGTTAAILVMGYSAFLARRAQRRMDEVQIASQGFASFRGWMWGLGITIVLLMLTPFSNRLIDLADFMTAGAPDAATRHRAAVMLGLYMGYMLLTLMQTICHIVAAIIWDRRMRAS
jgi:hypothetical protein